VGRSISNSRIWFHSLHHLFPSKKTGTGGSGIQNKSNKPKSKCVAPKYGDTMIKERESHSNSILPLSAFIGLLKIRLFPKVMKQKNKPQIVFSPVLVLLHLLLFLKSGAKENFEP